MTVIKRYTLINIFTYSRSIKTIFLPLCSFLLNAFGNNEELKDAVYEEYPDLLSGNVSISLTWGDTASSSMASTYPYIYTLDHN